MTSSEPDPDNFEGEPLTEESVQPITARFTGSHAAPGSRSCSAGFTRSTTNQQSNKQFTPHPNDLPYIRTMNPDLIPKTFFTLTDEDTTSCNSRSSRMTKKQAIGRAKYRLTHPTHRGCGIFLMKAVSFMYLDVTGQVVKLDLDKGGEFMNQLEFGYAPEPARYDAVPCPECGNAVWVQRPPVDQQLNREYLTVDAVNEGVKADWIYAVFSDQFNDKNFRQRCVQFFDCDSNEAIIKGGQWAIEQGFTFKDNNSNLICIGRHVKTGRPLTCNCEGKLGHIKCPVHGSIYRGKGPRVNVTREEKRSAIAKSYEGKPPYSAEELGHKPETLEQVFEQANKDHRHYTSTIVATTIGNVEIRAYRNSPCTFHPHPAGTVIGIHDLHRLERLASDFHKEHLTRCNPLADFWSQVPPQYQFLAMDKDGRWWLYGNEPECKPGNGVWTDRDNVDAMVRHPSVQPRTLEFMQLVCPVNPNAFVCWQDTLIRRS